MGAFDWLFGKEEVLVKGGGFDHAKIYGEVSSGPGVAVMSNAAASWKEQVSAAFSDAENALNRVLRDSEVMMQGSAGDQSRQAATPLATATQEAIGIAAQAGKAVGDQAQASADFKNTFPAPYKVPPDNIGFGDYLNPFSFAEKSGVRAEHEAKHDEVEAKARQQYESYTQVTNDRVGGIQHFTPPPTFFADVSPAQTAPVQKVDPDAGYTGSSGGSGYTGGSGTTQTSGYSAPSTAPTTSSPSQSSTVPPSQTPHVPQVPDTPAGSESSWTTPSSTGTQPPPSTTPTPGPGPAAGGGFVGGAVVPPSTGGGTTGGRTGGGVSGSGRGSSGTVGGGRTPGSGGVRPLGPGGSSGVGGSTSGGGSAAASGAGARGATSGVAGAGGPMGAQGRADDEDRDHENKYVEDTDEAWEELGLPVVAPPVFGDWDAEEDGPARPPERG